MAQAVRRTGENHDDENSHAKNAVADRDTAAVVNAGGSAEIPQVSNTVDGCSEFNES